MRKLLTVLLILVLSLMTACGTGFGEDQSGKQFPLPTNAPDPIAQAQEAKNAGNYVDAIAGFQSILEQDPKMHLGYLELADVYIRQNEFQKAYEILTLGKTQVDEGNISALENKLLEFNYANVILDSDKVPHGRVRIENDQLVWYHVYEYDTQKQQLTAVTHCDSEGSTIARLELTFNEQDQPLTSYAYYTDGNIEKLEFMYNATGQLSETREYTADGELASYSINEFDSNGYKIKESNYFSDNSIHWTLIYDHNVSEKSTELEIRFYGKRVGTQSMGFSDSGYPNRNSSLFKGAFDRMIEYDFDYFGNHVREEVIEEGTLVRFVCYNAPLSVLY